jgi:hypothetical protein
MTKNGNGKKSIKVTTGIKAGGWGTNHNRRLIAL